MILRGLRYLPETVQDAGRIWEATEKSTTYIVQTVSPSANMVAKLNADLLLFVRSASRDLALQLPLSPWRSAAGFEPKAVASGRSSE